MTTLNELENPGRRHFFKRLVASDADGSRPDGRRASVPDVDAGSGDVFWSGCAIDDEIFIVGDGGVILRFDGRVWHRMATPVLVPIHGIWGTRPDGLVAVGWMGTVLSLKDGEWALESGCVVGDTGKYTACPENTPLFAVTGDDDGNLWAVGDKGTIRRRQDGVWTVEESGTKSHLRAIARLADGRLVAAGANGAVLMRAHDGVWRSLDCPLRSNFQAILPVSNDEFILAGGRYFIGDNGFRGELVRWRVATFETVAANQPFARFRALASRGDGFIAVGDRGDAYSVGDSGIDRIDIGTQHDLLGLIRLPAGGLLAVGDFGTVRTVPSDTGKSVAAPHPGAAVSSVRWEGMASGTDRQLWGLWSDARSGLLYACGEEGTVLRCEGGQWEPLPPVGSLGVHALCAAPDGGVFAAGQLGEIHHFDGTAWRKHFDLHVDITILSLWSDGDSRVFAAGDEGLILAWDGRSWQRQVSGTKSALYGLWGKDADHLLAVGDFGMILRWNGRQWDEFHAGTENFVFDVWGDGLDNIFVVGQSGTIIRFDGRRWTKIPVRARSDLLAVSGGTDGVFAVGAAGAALRYDGRAWNREPIDFDGGLRAVAADTPQGVLAAGDHGTIIRRLSP